MGLFQKPPTGSFFLFYILIFICLFIYETIVRSSAWSFGHSDPDPSGVWTEHLSLRSQSKIRIAIKTAA